MAEKTFRVRVVYEYDAEWGPNAVGISRPYDVVSVGPISSGFASLILPDGTGIFRPAVAYHFGDTAPDDIKVHAGSARAVPWPKARSGAGGLGQEGRHLQSL